MVAEDTQKRFFRPNHGHMHGHGGQDSQDHTGAALSLYHYPAHHPHGDHPKHHQRQKRVSQHATESVRCCLKVWPSDLVGEQQHLNHVQAHITCSLRGCTL